MDESLSFEQKLYFQNSKVRDEKGNLLKVYHGSGTRITSFDPAFTGQGNDQYGSGFYFTTDREYAETYTEIRNIDQKGQEMEKLGGEDFPNVVEAYVNIKNPIYINGVKETGLSNVLIPNESVYNIVKELPSLYNSIYDEIEPNPLGDWFDEIWETNPQTKEDFKPFIKKMVDDYFQNTDLLVLDRLFGKYGTKLREAINHTMGYDGVIVRFFDNKHIIVAWFPEQIKVVKNLEPKISPFLMDKAVKQPMLMKWQSDTLEQMENYFNQTIKDSKEKWQDSGIVINLNVAGKEIVQNVRLTAHEVEDLHIKAVLKQSTVFKELLQNQQIEYGQLEQEIDSLQVETLSITIA